MGIFQEKAYICPVR